MKSDSSRAWYVVMLSKCCYNNDNNHYYCNIITVNVTFQAALQNHSHLSRDSKRNGESPLMLGVQGVLQAHGC